MSVCRRVDTNLVFSQESNTFEIISFLFHFLLIVIITIAIFLQFFGNGSQKLDNTGPYSPCFAKLTVSVIKACRHQVFFT